MPNIKNFLSAMYGWFLVRDNIILLLQFSLVGASGFCVNFFILNAAQTFLHTSKALSEVFAALIALQLTFILHDQWTYSQHHTSKYKLSFAKRYFSYLLTNSFGSIATVIMFWLLSHIINSSFIALSISAAVAMVWNFIINKVFIWQKGINLK